MFPGYPKVVVPDSGRYPSKRDRLHDVIAAHQVGMLHRFTCFFEAATKSLTRFVGLHYVVVQRSASGVVLPFLGGNLQDGAPLEVSGHTEAGAKAKSCRCLRRGVIEPP